MMKNLYFVSGFVLFVLLGYTAFAQSVFTASGTFIVPAGVDSITIEVVGAGGRGGFNGGGGGGGGGYATGTFAAVPLSSHAVIVGAGGSEIATTVAGFAISATAGFNGSSVANPTIGGGGIGGVGSGGTINRTGGTGGGGYWTYFGGGGGGAAGSVSDGSVGGNTIMWTGICQTPGGAGGAGGGAPGGAGGKGAGFTDANCTVTDTAGIGENYGGGGGGANGNGGVHGTGAGGYCRITWTVNTGADMISPKNNFMICENPFTGKISIQNAGDHLNYELSNSAGQIFWTGKNIQQEDFSDLANGLYFLKVQNQNSIQTFKLINH